MLKVEFLLIVFTFVYSRSNSSCDSQGRQFTGLQCGRNGRVFQIHENKRRNSSETSTQRAGRKEIRETQGQYSRRLTNQKPHHTPFQGQVK